TTRPAAEVANGLRKGSLGLSFLDRRVQRAEVTGTHTLTVTMGRNGAGFTAGDRELADGIEAAGGDWEIRALEEPRRTVYAALPVPALGWTAVRAVSGAPHLPGPVRVGARHLDSRLLRVEVAVDGTLTRESADGTRTAG